MKKKPNPGKVWLIGAGPGAPDLLTARARAALEAAHVILYDDLVNPSVLPTPYRWRTLIPVGKRAGEGAKQAYIERLMLRYAKQGKTVARLKGGDPFVLGRGGEEVIALRAARIPYEVVPGISSATGVPTLAGIPLTHRGVAASFAVVTGHLATGKDDREPEWELLAHSVDTLVIMMGVATFKDIAARLITAGKDARTPVAVIRWGSWPMEHRQIGTLADGAAGTLPVGTPSVIVIGEVVRLAERTGAKPPVLAGVRVAVTRDEDSEDALVRGLEARGAIAQRVPVISREIIRHAPHLADLRYVQAALTAVGRYDWVVIASSFTCFALDWLRTEWGIPRADFFRPRYAAIGEATANSVRYAFSEPALTARVARQEGLLKALGDVRGKRIFLPGALESRPALADGLRKAGALVTVAPVYVTVPAVGGGARLAGLVRSAEVDVITFTSGSIVRHALRAIGAAGRRKLADRRILAASIGPVTSAELRKHGIRPPIQARRASMEDLAASIARYYSTHPHAPRLR